MNLKNIGRRLSDDLGKSVTVKPIDDLGFKEDVPDATKKFIARTHDGLDLFLIVSGMGNPHIMKRAVENIKSVRNSVSSNVAEHILQPVASGDVEEMTYALWQAKKPFHTGGRIKTFFSRRRYSESILNWSESLTFDTLKDGDSSTFTDNLQNIYDDEFFPQQMRQDALLAQERIHAQTWQPKHCFQHGDFWVGNILLPDGPKEPSFYVIDWAGMQSDGYPFYDLARMLISLRCKSHIKASHIEMLRSHVGCDQVDVVSYILSGLGHIGLNLEHFPPDRYRSMAIQVYEFMKKY